jgi:hypothetical protein
MSCCTNDLGAHPHNTPGVDTGLLATIAGIYVFIIDFAGSIVRREATLGVGDPLVFPGTFNEQFKYHGRILDPNGNAVVANNCEDFSFYIYTELTDGCGDPCNN